ncbi:MAG TPA: leucyl aminopeptidase family protein, partial [Pseudorhizobium sp.]|nr:leucyl aminopeptidase family protein [Pseudorhizobium sp.]
MNSYRYIDRPSPLIQHSANSRPIYLVTPEALEKGEVDPAILPWARAAGFSGDAGSLLLLPGADGELAGALFGLDARA